MPRPILVALTSLALLAACGVREGGRQSAPDACERIGDRCRTADGPVGVCNDTGKRDCAEPPCLACMPQH